MSWGGNPWGGGAWGGGSGGPGPVLLDESLTIGEGLSIVLPLVVTAVSAISPFGVEVTFSHNIDLGFSPNFTQSNYSISPYLPVVTVVPGPFPNTVVLNTFEQGAINYTLTIATGRSVSGDLLNPPDQVLPFAGFFVTPRFQAAAQSVRKVMLVFSSAMQQNADFTDPTNYTVRDLNGNTIPVVAANPQGNAPISRVTLTLGADLLKGGYYVAEVDPSVKTTSGLSMSPPVDVFRWNVMEAPINVGPLVIPIDNFSGEVSGGLLGQPAGQVFFSPALDVSVPNSVIQVEDVSVCTRAFDVYEFPNPPDPIPFFTYGGGPVSLLGALGAVLWAPAERLGQARVQLQDARIDAPVAPTDGLAAMILREPIKITRGGFLNDARWHTYNGAATTFTVLDNLTPVGPGGTSYSIYANDVVQVTDSLSQNPLFSGDVVNATDSVSIEVTKLLSDTVSVLDTGTTL